MASPTVRNVVTPQRQAPLPPASAAAGLIPGILLLAVVGYAGKFIEQFIAHYGKAHHMVLPNIEYVLWAILYWPGHLEYRRHSPYLSFRGRNL
jgi:hypothetical protein